VGIKRPFIPTDFDILQALLSMKMESIPLTNVEGEEVPILEQGSGKITILV